MTMLQLKKAVGIEFLAKNNIAILEQPPYSTDLVPCDFLFPKLKELVFVTWKPLKSFQECVEAWQKRLEKYIWAQGDYFEGDM